jgi:hypothetical protein
MDQTVATGACFSCEGPWRRRRDDRRKQQGQQGQRDDCDGTTMVSHEEATGDHAVEQETCVQLDSMFSHDLAL